MPLDLGNQRHVIWTGDPNVIPHTDEPLEKIAVTPVKKETTASLPEQKLKTPKEKMKQSRPSMSKRQHRFFRKMNSHATGKSHDTGKPARNWHYKPGTPTVQ